MGAEGGARNADAPFRRLPRKGATSSSSASSPASSPLPTFFFPLLFPFILLSCLSGVARAMSYDNSYGNGATQENWRITCYTCVNVSNNEECNRFAIDRPCPEGRDFCLTLHVMEELEMESVLVNKRCAPLQDCVGDSIGCVRAYGQTQCVSCCDQPYCNESVPSNDTNAIFSRSRASGSAISWAEIDVIWRTAVVLIAAVTLGGPS